MKYQPMKNLKIPQIEFLPDGALEKMLSMQEKFNSQFYDKSNLSLRQRVDWALKMQTALIIEMAEFTEHLPFKWWNKNKKLSLKEAQFELIDQMCFLLGAMSLMEMDAKSIYSMYLAKMNENNENWDRHTPRRNY